MILAVVLSMLTLMAWHYFVELPMHEEREKQRAAEAAKQAETTIPETPSPAAIDAPSQKLNRAEALTQAPRITIESELLQGSLSLKGARIDDLVLKGYRQTSKEDSPPVTLLSPSNTASVYFAETGWAGASKNVTTPNANTVWRADSTTLTPGTPLTLSWTSPENVHFTITILLDDAYMFHIKHSVSNKSTGAVGLAPYGLVNRTWQQDGQDFFILHEGPIAVLDEILHEIDYSDLVDDGEKKFSNTQGWLGFSDKYWLTALVPQQNTPVDVRFSQAEKAGTIRYQLDFIGEQQLVSPGEIRTFSTYLFAGAKKVDLLDGYSEELNIPLFDRAVDFGWLYFLTKPFFIALTFFYGLVGNFGIAILLLTVVIKAFMFPLANKSYKSMNQLKALQPELMKLRERYKDDKMKMNQEMMAFYKREKVNPAAGCFPILIQIPVFFALYKVLFITIEMRHAPFFGWIQDLSAPDPTSIFNLFGLLPYVLPQFLEVGVWPILLGITMWIQQKLNPTPPDPVQASVLKVLPFIFVFVFSSFPAGLVIYWTWNNILSIIQQRLIAGGIKKQKT